MFFIFQTFLMTSSHTVPIFLQPCFRTVRKAVPSPVILSAPSNVRRAREEFLAVKGVQLFNLLNIQLMHNDHVDVKKEMFKNNLDIYLGSIPDQPTSPGLPRGPCLLIYLTHKLNKP